MPFGYNDLILRVDLSKEKISAENYDPEFYRRYFGGQGFVAYFLLKELEADVDPFSGENKLIFAAGPITGSLIPGSGRNSIGAKSPLTGGFGEAEVGGYWGAELKHSGFDAIIVEGKAKSPVYLKIMDGDAEICEASHLWKMDTGETESALRKEIGDNLIRVAQIGVGGENLVRYACVIVDLKNAAGRTGMGAIMGSKKLKAVAVRGHNKLEVAESRKLKDLARWLSQNIDEKVAWAHTYGTGNAMVSYAESGNLPTRNFRDGDFIQASSIDAVTIKNTVRIGMEGCYACPIRCKKMVKIGKPWNVNPIYGGPEYEALASLGSNCGVDNLKAICKANELCNRYSLDVISTGSSIAFAMECYEKELLSSDDTNGIRLEFGNAEAMVKMVEMIGRREGLGDILAEGTKRAAKLIGRGAEDLAIQVKGQDLPMHEPRLQKGLALGYAVSPTGADHQHNIFDTRISLKGVDLNNFASLGVIEPVPVEDMGPRKVRALVYRIFSRVLNNCLVMCNFVPWDHIQRAGIVRGVTGWNATSWELMKVGERVTNMARMFNLRAGFKKDDDWLPKRFFLPQTSGALSDTAIDPDQLSDARDSYYEMMGWDCDGVPKKSKLDELDIGWTAAKSI